MANKLNMAIAKTHRLSSRLVGMQITGGNFIGIGLSALQMSAGFLIVGSAILAQSWIMYPVIMAIGIALAILIERLSLGGLSAVRVSKEKKGRAEDAYYAMLQREKRDPTEAEKEHFERQVQAFENDRKSGRNFAAVGMVLSAGIGDVFWHFLFSSMGPLGYVLSTACAAVISLTFIHSELFKALMDGVLHEILVDMRLMKVAVAAEEQNMQLDMMVQAYDRVKTNEEVYLPAQSKVEKTVGKRLASFADQINVAAEQANGIGMVSDITIVDSTLAYPQIAAPRGKYPQNRSELLRLMKSNPNISVGDIASHFSISKSTASDWLKKARAGL